MYATLADLSAVESLRDLAQAAAPDHPDVDADLLAATLAGGARSTYSAAERAAADAAMARLQRHLDDAHAEVEGWIGARYPSLADPPAALKAYAVDVALYRIFRPGAPEDPRLLRYKSAIKYLQEVARGTIDLSAPAPDPDVSAGVMSSTPRKVFDANNNGSFYGFDLDRGDDRQGRGDHRW